MGDKIASSLQQFFAQERNQQVLEQFARLGVKVKDLPPPKGQAVPLQGKTVVFTGALQHYTRQEARERVEALGGRVTSSVSGKTDVIVAGENPGSKLPHADDHHVTVLDEDAFREIIDPTA